MTEDRVLPHDLDAERFVLASILADNSRLELVRNLTSIDFLRHDHRLYFEAFLRLAARGMRIDYVTTHAEITEPLDGARAYLAQLDDGMPQGADVVSYARIVKTLAAARRGIYQCNLTTSALYENPHLIGNGLPAKHAAAWQEIAEDAAEPHKSDTILLDDVAIMSRPPLTYLVQDMIPKGALVGGIGAPEVGKTAIFAVDLGMCIATGTAFHGRAVSRGPVIGIHAEGQGNIQNRIAAWKVAHAFPLEERAGYYVWLEPVNLLDAVAVTRFVAHARQVMPVYVVIDTLQANTFGFDENSSRDMGMAVAATQRIGRELSGAVVMLLHHPNASNTKERGHTSLRGACDVMMLLTLTDDQLVLSCEKAKDAPKFPDLALKLVPVPGGDACVVRVASEVLPSACLTDAQGKLLHVLRESFKYTGATIAELETALPHVGRRQLYRANQVLIDAGFVAKKGQRFEWSGKAVTACDRAVTSLATSDDFQNDTVFSGL